MTEAQAIPRHWDAVRWPWWAAAVLVVTDLAGLAIARFHLGWHVSGCTSGDRIGGALMGPWGIVMRTLLAGVFLAFYTGRGTPWPAFGLAFDALGLRARRFAVDGAFLVAGVAAFGAACVAVLRMAGQPQYIQCPGAATPEFVVVFVVALPPLEEVVYRGIVHGTMRRHMGPAGAVFVGGLLFGLVHWFYGIPLEWVWSYALGGMALAFLYERTGSLLFSWIAHVAVNITAAAMDRHQAFFAWLRGE